ncbi:HAMP domain-containing sensor histidine kinase [Halobacteriovorax sp. HFRX-2_2]|uniref:sensor histidine kinase n=1 Tax=unclassified Halobacteriovorax TaxID=2639665 RepID=UPI0037175741
MEVSNKALVAYFDGVSSMGDSVEDFISELPVKDKNLLDVKSRITWQEFKDITIFFSEKYPNYTEIISNTGVSNRVIKPFFDIVTYFISYSLLYEFFLKLSFKMLYTNIKIDTKKLSSDSFQIIFEFSDPAHIFHEFINMYVELFKTIPVNFIGCRTYSKVKYLIVEDRVVFSVRNAAFAKVSIPNLLYNFFFTKKKLHEVILKNVEYSNLLEKQNLELEEYRKSLELLNTELNLSNRTLHHDVANKLLSLEVAKKRIENGEYEQAVNKINQFSNSVKGIIQNSIVTTHIDGELFELEEINLYDLLIEAVTEYDDIAIQKGVRIIHDFKIDQNLTIYTNKIALQNNLISNIMYNAIKFSHMNDSIVFSASVCDENLCLRIVDFGVGIPEEKLKLIKKNVGLIGSTKGTNGEKGSGHGMSIIMDTANALGFKVNISSSLGNGTSIELLKNISQEETDFNNVLYLDSQSSKS